MASGSSVIPDRMQISPAVPSTFGARMATTGILAPHRQHAYIFPIKYNGGSMVSLSSSMWSRVERLSGHCASIRGYGRGCLAVLPHTHSQRSQGTYDDEGVISLWQRVVNVMQSGMEGSVSKNGGILLANPQVPTLVCPTCLLGRRNSLGNFPEKK